MKTFKEYTKLDEVYGTVKISGKRGRLVQHSPGEVVFVGNKKQAEKNLKQLKKDGGDGYIMQGVTIKVGEKVKGVGEERDYKDEYKKFQSSPERIKYRAELVKYNRDKGTYGNGDKKDASHKDGKIVGFEVQSKNRGRVEASRIKKDTKVDEDKKMDALKLALAIRNFKKRGGKIDKQPENMEKWWGQLSPEDKKRAKNIAQYKKNKKK